MVPPAPAACDRCGALLPDGQACARHPAAGHLRMRRTGDRARAEELQARDPSRHLRAGLAATLAAVLGAVALLLQSVAPWASGSAPVGVLAAVAIGGAAALVTVALFARAPDAADAPPRARWLRSVAQTLLVLGAPYALLGVGELLLVPDSHPLLAVAKAVPFLLGLAALEARRKPPARPVEPFEQRPSLAR